MSGSTASPAAGPELCITRHFDAPRRLVFDAWTRPEHLKHWQGAPVGLTVTTDVYDFRPGGMFRICMHSPDGIDYWLEGVYREIVEPERLVFTHHWLDPEGRPRQETLVTITFAEGAGGTDLTLRQTGFASVGSRDGHGEGWNSTFDRLAGYLYQQQLQVATGHGAE